MASDAHYTDQEEITNGISMSKCNAVIIEKSANIIGVVFTDWC